MSNCKSVRHFLTMVLSATLAIGPNLLAAGGSAVGSFSSTGRVSINGKPAIEEQALMAGDLIEAEGAATGLLRIAPNGAAQFTASAKADLLQESSGVAIRLHKGYVAVRQGDRAMSVLTRGGRVSASAGSLFEVAQVKDKTYVTATKGEARLSGGGLSAPANVRQGQTVEIAFLEAPPMPPAQATQGQQKEETEEEKRRKAGAGTAGQGKAGAGTVSVSPAVVAATAAVVAAAAAGIAAAIATQGSTPAVSGGIVSVSRP